MDVGQVIGSASVVALVNLVVIGLVGGFVRGAVQRWVERRDKRHDDLEGEVRQLRDVRVTRIESDMSEHKKEADNRHRSAAESRKALHGEVARLDRDKVSWADCNRMHDGYVSQVQELAKVTERVDAASKRTGDLFDRVIGVKEDVDRMLGRLEALEGME